MLLHLLDINLITLAVDTLKIHQQADARLVCKSFRAAVGDFETKVKEAAEKFTQIQKLSPSNFLLHTRLGKHAVEFSPINPKMNDVAKEYAIRVNQQRYVGAVASANVNDKSNARVAVLHARNGFHYSEGNKTWITEINTTPNGRITSVQTRFVNHGMLVFVNFDLRDEE